MNRDKGKIVLEVIRSDRERHDQSRWTNIVAQPGYVWGDGTVAPDFGEPKVKEHEGQIINCGTTACLAGHTGFIFAPVGTKFYKDSMRLPDMSIVAYEDFATKELGLTLNETNYLFSGIRTFEELEGYIESTDDEQANVLSDMNFYDEDED